MFEFCQDCKDKSNCTVRLQTIVTRANPDNLLSTLLIILLMRTDLQKSAIRTLEDRAFKDRKNARAFDNLRYQMKTFIETPNTCTSTKEKLKKIFLSGADVEQLYAEMKKDYEHIYSFIELLCELNRPDLGAQVGQHLSMRVEEKSLLYTAAMFDFLIKIGDKASSEIANLIHQTAAFDGEAMDDICSSSSGRGEPFVH